MTPSMPTDRGALTDTAAEVLVAPRASVVSLNAAGLAAPLAETDMMQSADSCPLVSFVQVVW